MTLRDQMILDAGAVFNLDEFGEMVSYLADTDNASAIPIAVIIAQAQDPAAGGPVVTAQATMAVQRADFPGLPPKGTVTRGDGTAWVIGRELSSGPMLRRVEIRHNPRARFQGGR